MSNLSFGQIIIDAQRMASRAKDLDSMGSALLEEAENNNRLVESLRQYQDDIESLNRISNNKTNADIVNRIQQQNVNSSEILKENRELKICIEDYERAMELIMQKYREHSMSKVLDTKISFKEIYNERLWKIIREQREKINEMAAVMQRAASADDDHVQRELQIMSRLRLENETLREMLQISRQFGSAQHPMRENSHLLEEKAVQTECDDSADDLSISGASAENVNNNSVIQVYSMADQTTTMTTTAVTNAKSNTTLSNITSTVTAIDNVQHIAVAAVSQTTDGAPDNAAAAEIVVSGNNNSPTLVAAENYNHNALDISPSSSKESLSLSESSDGSSSSLFEKAPSLAAVVSSGAATTTT